MPLTHHGDHIPRNDYGKLIAIILLLCLLAAAGYALQLSISCFLLSWIIACLLDPLVTIIWSWPWGNCSASGASCWRCPSRPR